MTLQWFEGAAGTGKTTRLVESTREWLGENDLQEGQRVLALTKYHGSRRRMDAKFKGVIGAPVDCITIDSFAWRLVRRWRSTARHLGITPERGDFPAITVTAGSLLLRQEVGHWVGRRYPLVLVDEMQDCKSGEVAVLSGLERYAHCIFAADEFQDLTGDRANEAVDWARTVSKPVPLEYNQRTKVTGLLSAAHSLRSGLPIEFDRRKGIEIVPAPRAPAGGGSVSWRLTLWQKHGEIAIISPVKAGTSPFVDGLLEWVASNRARGKGGVTTGPYSIDWESSHESIAVRVLTALGLPTDLEEHLPCSQLAETAHQVGSPDVAEWLHKQRRIGGRESIRALEIAEEVKRIVHRRRAYSTPTVKRWSALTIHQAKNREFESVIVLWPLKMQSEPEQQRRLLYNAITRARRQVLVVLEDPKKKRSKETPFV